MKTYKSILTESVLAQVDIPRFRFVGFTGGLCGADVKALGVSEVSTKQGQYCPVIVFGVALVEAAGAISVGARVFSNASGKATATGTNNPNGFALDAAAADGDIIRVVLA